MSINSALPRLTLTNVSEWTGFGHRHRREEWSIEGGEIDPAWRKGQTDDWKPWCRFVLYIVDDTLDRRLASYGGAAWPLAWRDLFEEKHPGTYSASVNITDEGLALRAAKIAAQGASNA